MKKFGTPTDGAPGNDTENVGFRALGTPRPAGALAVRVRVVRRGRFAGWRWACRAAWDREPTARQVARSERELVGRAAAIELVDGRGVALEVVPGVVPAAVVVDRVVDVGVDGVVAVAAGAGGATAVVVGGAGAVVGPAGATDPEVEVETGVGGVTGATEVVVGVLVVVDAGGLVVVVDVVVTVVVVDEVVDVVVVVVPLPAHEFTSVTALKSIDPAAEPS